MGSWDIRRRYSIALIAGMLLPSCHLLPQTEGPGDGPSEQPGGNGPIAVEAAKPQVGSLQAPLQYTGSTQPEQRTTLRAQTAGAIVSTQAEVGDAVAPGEVLAHIDSNLLTAQVNEAQAELSVRQSEVAVDQVSITDAQAAAIQAQATRDQAQLDADRLRHLADRGAISQQAAEAAELALINAQQTVASAQAQVSARKNAIAAANGRVNAQRAVVDEAKAQLQWVNVTAPSDATVLTKLVEPGDYVQPGTPIFELGNLSRLTVVVQVSELDIGTLSLGQAATVRFDAFSDLTVTGNISRISPVADATSRLIPVEVSLANPDQRLGSGLLARIQFDAPKPPTVVIPTSALNTGPENNPGPEGTTTIYVLKRGAAEPTVTARSVTTGERHQGSIEILSGLAPDETFIVASDRPLQPNQAVRLSILSEVNVHEN